MPSILNPESSYKAYETTQKTLEEKRPVLEQQILGGETAGATLESRLATREQSPEARAREREIIGQLFAAPSDVESRLEAAGVAPTAIGGAVGDRMNNYLSQLDQIQDARKSRQDYLSQIVKSYSTAAQAGAKKSEIDLKKLESDRDQRWKEYQQARDEYEWAEEQKAKAATSESDNSKKNAIINKFNTAYAEEKAKQMQLHGNTWETDWDGKLDPNTYADLINYANEKLGPDGTNWVTSTFKVSAYVNLNNLENRDILQKKAGIDVNKIISTSKEEDLSSMFYDEIKNVLEGTIDEINNGDLDSATNDLINIGARYSGLSDEKIKQILNTQTGSSEATKILFDLIRPL